ncbi:hypothetical protein BD626DRAFT_272258 [Schizophyllum amplum]|uniref:Uncharacterized protein n=1 Tax=Schizophyllum amplum TaxID=97359 RepID=A0A550CF90_9AGAR|nr:hypothetical protein BD626DRAFT_272258 [Auriculariopsis ampla]
MPVSIPSYAISSRKDALNTGDIVNHRLAHFDAGKFRRQVEHLEYYWGLEKGTLDLATPLNHVQVCPDMAKRMDAFEWTLMPTKETVAAMMDFVTFNKTADVHSRMVFTELPEVDYEYEFVPLIMLEDDRRPTLYVDDGKTITALRAPYKKMPRIRSRAHPLFVVFMSEDRITSSAFQTLPEKKAMALMDTCFAITRSWKHRPPLEFLVGPDVWQKHRHPLSDDGSVARLDLTNTKTKRATKESRVRKTTAAPCRQPKSGRSRQTMYDSTIPPKHLKRSSGRSIAVLHDDEQKTCDAADPQEIGKWVNDIQCEALTTSAARGDSEPTDAQLAEYRREAARDPANALRFRNGFCHAGLIYGADTDYSAFSSNDWAMLAYHRALWSSEPSKYKSTKSGVPRLLRVYF